jgi:lipopolysaccharide heptosyltransferase II
MTVDRAGIQRLVVRAPNWLGDAVLALPAIAGVRAAFPHAVLAVAAPAAIAPIFDEDTCARPDQVIALTDRRNEPAQLAAGRFDAALLLPNSFRSAYAARRASIPHRWGYAGNVRGWLLTEAVGRPRERGHQSQWYSDLVRALEIDVGADLPQIRVKAETRTRADALLEKAGVQPGTPLIGFAPGAVGGHAKRWPPRRYAEVVARLGRERGATALLFGVAGDRDAGREIESVLPQDARVVNLIGRTDLRLLAGLVAACSAFVSNDSGAMHLAAALGVPVAAIIGPTDERATAPLGNHDVLVHQVFCRPCMLRDCPIDHRCMTGIGVDAVFAAVTRRLELPR